MPKKGKGFGVQTGGSIGDVKETKRFEVQDEPVLVARPRCSSRGEQRASSLRRRAVLRQCFGSSVIEPIGSGRLS
jgi:hypothetical protein